MEEQILPDKTENENDEKKDITLDIKIKTSLCINNYKGYANNKPRERPG